MNKVLSLLFTMFVGMAAWATDITITPSDFALATSSDFSTTKDGVTVAVAGSTVTADQIRIFKGKTITIKNTKNGGGVLGESREKAPTDTSEKKKNKGVKGSSRQGDTGSVAGAERLPQTGQLWWPVWLLSGLSAVLVLIGLILRMSGKKDLKD